MLSLVLPYFLLFLAWFGAQAGLAYAVLSRIPPPHRKRSPALAFLLLIPFFSQLWAFEVHTQVAASLRSYFAARDDRTVGDCGAFVALCFCGSPALALWLPGLRLIVALGSAFLLMVFYTRAFELAARIGPPRASAGEQY